MLMIAPACIYSPPKGGGYSILQHSSHSKGIHLSFSLSSFPLAFHLGCYLIFSLPPILFKQWSRTPLQFLKYMSVLLHGGLDFLMVYISQDSYYII